MQTEITFLDHRMSNDGIATDPVKIQLIKDWRRRRQIFDNYAVFWVWQDTTDGLYAATLRSWRCSTI